MNLSKVKSELHLLPWKYDMKFKMEKYFQLLWWGSISSTEDSLHNFYIWKSYRGNVQ